MKKELERLSKAIKELTIPIVDNSVSLKTIEKIKENQDKPIEPIKPITKTTKSTIQLSKHIIKKLREIKAIKDFRTYDELIEYFLERELQRKNLF